MHLKRYQLALMAVIVALFAFNLFRARRPNAPAPTPNRVTAPAAARVRGTSPAWSAYDTAAQARDADAATWAPALAKLHTAQAEAAGSPEAQDLEGCETWLLFYRNERLHPTHRPGFADQTREHVDNCVRDHADSAH